MPRIVPCYRTRKDSAGKIITVEKLMMLEPDANEAVKNGKGEWSRQEPQGVAIVELPSRNLPAEPGPRRSGLRTNE